MSHDVTSQDMLHDIITSILHVYMLHNMTLYMFHDITTSSLDMLQDIITSTLHVYMSHGMTHMILLHTHKKCYIIL